MRLDEKRIEIINKLLDEVLQHYKDMQQNEPDNLSLPRFHNSMKKLIRLIDIINGYDIKHKGAYTKIGSFCTVGELKSLLEPFQDSVSLGFINQPQQDLYLKIETDGQIYLGFQ